MNRFLDVIVFHVRDAPEIARIFPQRITRRLSRFRTLEMFLAGVLLRDSHRIKVEHIVVGLREPRNRLVPARQAAGAMQAMPEMPDDAIPHLEPKRPKRRPECNVERDDFVVPYEIADLPAERAIIRQDARTLLDHPGLPGEVLVQAGPAFVSFSDVVGRGRDDQASKATWQLAEKIERVAQVRYRIGLWPECFRQS
jgi:hypothetical protein